LENVDAKLDRRNDNRAVEMPPYAQGTSGGKKHRGQEQKTEWGKKKIDDSAYKAALERIPVPAKRYDPWQNVRSAPGIAAH
jgi:hypothetical protein